VALEHRKSSARADIVHGGWPKYIVDPSGGWELSWDGKSGEDPTSGYWDSREMSQAKIKGLMADFAKAAE